MSEEWIASVRRGKLGRKKRARALGRRVFSVVKPLPVGQTVLHQAIMSKREVEYVRLKRLTIGADEEYFRRVIAIQKNTEREQNGA